MVQVGDDYISLGGIEAAVPAMGNGPGRRFVPLQMHLSTSSFVAISPPAATMKPLTWA